MGSHSRKHFAGGENVMLELILEGGTEFYEAFQAGKHHMQRPRGKKKHIMISELYLVGIARAEV